MRRASFTLALNAAETVDAAKTAGAATPPTAPPTPPPAPPMPPLAPPAPPGCLRVIITYLAMREPPAWAGSAGPAAAAAAAPMGGAEAVCVPSRTLSVAAYRLLYNGVGESWLWHERRRMSDTALATVLAEPARELVVLRLNGRPAGYGELDRQLGHTVNLAYFGLFPAAIGQRLGPWLLDRTLACAWSSGAHTVTVNTCTFDHPKALALYLSRGFQPVEHVTRVLIDPRLTGLLPISAAPHIPLAARP